MPGLGTQPVEGRWDAGRWDGDPAQTAPLGIGAGTGPGVWDGDSRVIVTIISLPLINLKRTPPISLVRSAPENLKRTPPIRFVRRP